MMPRDVYVKRFVLFRVISYGWCIGVNQGIMVWSFDIPHDKMKPISFTSLNVWVRSHISIQLEDAVSCDILRGIASSS
jgi:hypothetical protein